MGLAASLLIMAACEEAKRFEISGGDKTPPGEPVFVGSKPLPGGARVFFIPPDDEDVLAIEASYLNADGKKVRFIESYFTDSLDVLGFGKAGAHLIELCAIDRSGNRSTSILAAVEALAPPVELVAKSLKLLPSFASMLVKWTNTLRESVYVTVEYSFMLNGEIHNFTRVFSTFQTEMRPIDSLKLFHNEPVLVKVSVKDKYGNMVSKRDTTIVLLTDELIPKDRWLLPVPGITMGIMQADGVNHYMAIDDLIEINISSNYFITTMNNPWNFIIDLGEEYELSRIVTHQRWSGASGISVQGNLYSGNNVLNYNLYVWNGRAWQLLSRCNIIPPMVMSETEYTDMGKAGDMFFIFPEEPRFSIPARWVRLEALSGKYISEITLYGRKAQ